MQSVRFLFLAAMLGVLLLGGCRREILPSEYYELKPAEERERDKINKEEEELAAAPEIPVIGEDRTWTAADGGSTIEGAMMYLEGNRVFLRRKADGTSMGIPLSRLTEADQQYAKDMAAKHPGGSK